VIGRWWKRQHAKRAFARADLVHGPNYFLPPAAESGIITIHDLSVFRFPQTHPPERLRAFDRAFKGSLRRARHVLTSTETVRLEVMDFLGLGPDQVSAVPLGVDPMFTPAAVTNMEALSSFGLYPGNFALSVAAFEPRKRIDLLIAAWRRLAPALRDRFPLVLVGVPGWRNEALRKQIDDGMREGWLRMLGFVPDADLPAVYAGARLFLYPSQYEGFGLPPLEAMASGVPVLTAPLSCLPEVCGSAALYADAADDVAYARAIEQALTDDPWRDSAIARGLKRTADFTWARCVNATAAVYREVIAAA